MRKKDKSYRQKETGELIMDKGTAIAFPLIAIFLYFLPYACASQRRHRSKAAIFLTNLLFGWTGVGWIFALIWAFTGNVERPA
jgi:Superinfection immunity protein